MNSGKDDLQNWRLIVTTRKRKTDYVYYDNEDYSWSDTYELQPSCKYSSGSVEAKLKTLIFRKNKLGAVLLVITEPAGGLSLVKDTFRRVLRPGRTVSAGYSFGNDDYSASYHVSFALKKV